MRTFGGANEQQGFNVDFEMKRSRKEETAAGNESDASSSSDDDDVGPTLPPPASSHPAPSELEPQAQSECVQSQGRAGKVSEKVLVRRRKQRALVAALRAYHQLICTRRATCTGRM